MDRLIHLMAVLTGYPEIDMQVDVAGHLFAVKKVDFDADRIAVVMRLHAEDVRDVLHIGRQPQP